MKHAWLAIDPGITTGWALLDDDGTVLGTSVWGTHELRDSLDLLIRQAFSSAVALEIVIERMPAGATGPLAQKLEWVRKQIDFVIRETYEIPTSHITPGEWKPSRVARTTELPKQWQGSSLMTHQKDAIKMGRYAIDKRRQTKEKIRGTKREYAIGPGGPEHNN